jgi:hypothetical protein
LRVHSGDPLLGEPPDTGRPADHVSRLGRSDSCRGSKVVDSDGRPIATLDADKFDVTIDGRTRRVVSADLVRAGAPASAIPNRPLGSGPTASNAWPLTGRGDRTFILAVDAGSFEAGEAIPVVQAARGFVDRLSANDLVGVFTLPPFGPRVDPTIGRVPVRKALDLVAGQRQSMPGQFNLSSSEVVDIMAETTIPAGRPSSC